MYRGVLLFLIVVTLIVPISGSYCALDCENLKILAEKNKDHVQSVASISKVMTALIVLEHASLYEMVEIDPTMLHTEGSSIYLIENEIYSIETLLYGLLLRSGNDAAMALALYTSDHDLDTFIQWMNDKATQIGMMHTQFENPSGLEKPQGNLSSAYDMALLMCYVSDHVDLMKILGTTSYTTSKHGVWSNKNRLLKMNERVIGGKTGFTNQAGRTLLSIAEEGYRISIATLDMYDDFEFHDRMYDRLFTDKKMRKIFTEGIYQLNHKKFVVHRAGYILESDLNQDEYVFTSTNTGVTLKYLDYTWVFPWI
ncbi:MAG: D-alanyl-D-alanine carboxypeptidase [Erysipelotrichales bacterium]|nr:D-alanyl-D-alanine carboxypeptidase [Erysipelotrichales bacterium]